MPRFRKSIAEEVDVSCRGPRKKKKLTQVRVKKTKDNTHTHKGLRWLREGMLLQQDVPGIVDRI